MIRNTILAVATFAAKLRLSPLKLFPLPLVILFVVRKQSLSVLQSINPRIQGNDIRGIMAMEALVVEASALVAS
jgi:hypothetical protein